MLGQRLRAIVVGGVLAAVAATGCGDGRLATHPVSGKVQYKSGKPAAGGKVGFQTVINDHPVTAAAGVADDGTFTATTYVAGDGLPAGTYKVSIAGPRVGDGQAAKDLAYVPIRYRDPETSGLTCRVVPGPNTVTFEIDDKDPPGTKPADPAKAPAP